MLDNVETGSVHILEGAEHARENCMFRSVQQKSRTLHHGSGVKILAENFVSELLEVRARDKW